MESLAGDWGQGPQGFEVFIWGVAPNSTSFSKRKKQRVFAKLRFAEEWRKGKNIIRTESKTRMIFRRTKMRRRTGQGTESLAGDWGQSPQGLAVFIWCIPQTPLLFSKRKKQRVFAKLRFAEGQRKGKKIRTESKTRMIFRRTKERRQTGQGTESLAGELGTESPRS